MHKLFIDDLNSELITLLIIEFIVGFFLMKWNSLVGYIFLVVSIVITVVRYFYRRRKEVDDMTRLLADITKGNYNISKSYKEGELSKLYHQIYRTSLYLDDMSQELKNQRLSMKNAMTDISHQLKSPIASLKILNELQKDDEIVLKSRKQIDRLKTLVDSLLRLVKLETKTEVFDIVDENISDAILEAVEGMRPLFTAKKLEIEFNTTDAIVRFDWDKTLEVMQHILNNKLRFADSKVVISIEENPMSVYVKISDDGVPIDKSLRNKVFERFYSGSNRTENSLGVGLAIAKEIMEQQQGSITVEGSNTFVLRFAK